MQRPAHVKSIDLGRRACHCAALAQALLMLGAIGPARAQGDAERLARAAWPWLMRNTLRQITQPHALLRDEGLRVPLPPNLAPGTYGMALNYDGANPIYSNPTTQTPPLGGTYVSTEATFDCTVARVRAVPAGQPFGGNRADLTGEPMSLGGGRSRAKSK